MKIEAVQDIEINNIINKIFIRQNKAFSIYAGFRKFAYALKSDDGRAVGGIIGICSFDEIFIDELCVEEEFRGLGYGRKLLEVVENEIALDGKYENINLFVFEFRKAVNFYKKCGFEIEFIRKNDKNTKLNKYYMIKKLRVDCYK